MIVYSIAIEVNFIPILLQGHTIQESNKKNIVFT